MFKYRARPPTYAHILLTTSETFWTSFLPTLKSFRANSSENKSKNYENHVFLRVTHYFAVLPSPQLTSYESITFLRQNDFKPFTHRILLKILFIRSCNEKTRFRELRKSIFRFLFFSQGRISAWTSLFFLTKCSNIELVHQHMTTSC